MTNKKFTISELEVKSFITAFLESEEHTIKGGNTHPGPGGNNNREDKPRDLTCNCPEDKE